MKCHSFEKAEPRRNVFRRILVVSILLVLALGAIALTGLWHPNAPDPAMQTYLPKITLPAVVVAGVIDGINPCAFTVLLLFITAMLATLQSGEQSVSAVRARLLSRGGIYIAAVFLTYLSLGVGMLKVMDIFTLSWSCPVWRTASHLVWLVDGQRFLRARLGLAPAGARQGWDHRTRIGEKSDRPCPDRRWLPDRLVHGAVQWGGLPGRT
jgi:hypothetical protein